MTTPLGGSSTYGPPELRSRTLDVGRVAAVCVATAVSGLALLGWATNRLALESLGSDDARMTPLSAIVMLGIAVAVALDARPGTATSGLRRGVAVGVVSIVLAIVVLGLLAMIGIEPIALNRLLFADALDVAAIAGWPAPQTCVAGLLLGAALLIAGPGAGPAQRTTGAVLAAGAASVGALGLLGHGLRIGELYSGEADGPGFGLGTTICTLVLATYLAVALVEDQVGRFQRARAWAGTMRVLVPAVLLVPVVMAVADAAAASDSRNIRFLLSLVGVTGSVLVLGLTWRMATRQLEREERLLRAQRALDLSRREAEAANAAKSQFLSRVSHELRTPLNAVLGFAQLLENDDLADDQREQVGFIRRSGEHLLQLVNDVLDLSSLDSGELPLDVASVSLRRIVDDPIELMATMAGDARVTLAASDEGVDRDRVAVLVDLRRARQIVLNLLSNAIKYNQAGGSVSVRCEAASDGRLAVCVADTGPGIATDRIPLLFEPFERLGAERTEIGGTGIGLSLSRRLAESMDCELEVDSVVGVGSTFRLSMPVASDHEPIAEPAATP